jgi:SAM-dependent methyltransferase
MGSNFQDHFSGVAAGYAEFRPRYPAALFDYLRSLVPKEAPVWDCACGNGQATLDLAERFDRVIATDASEKQIAEATPHPRVDYRVAPAERSGLPDASVGMVTVAQAVHWFDFGRFHAEVTRVLLPGGVLAVWGYGVQKVEGEAVNELVQDFYSNVVGPYWPPERKWIEEGYRSLPFPFDEVRPPSFRMETRWTLDQLLGYLGTWSATTRCQKATGVDPIPPLRERLREHWPDGDNARTIVWPLAIRIGRKL